MTLEETSKSLLDQDFALLEEALNGGVWEVDGDDLNLYVSDGEDGPAGAVLVAAGDSGAEAELAHQVCGGRGARVTRLVLRLLCEELDPESDGTFSAGLAYDEDYEEASLLSVTLRRPRHSPGELEEHDDPRSHKVEPVGLHLNGQLVAEDVGQLPCCVELDASLRWDGERTVALRYHVSHEGASPDEESVVGEASAGFYTQGVRFESAKALYVRLTGCARVRLLSTRCECAAGDADEAGL